MESSDYYDGRDDRRGLSDSGAEDFEVNDLGDVAPDADADVDDIPEVLPEEPETVLAMPESEREELVAAAERFVAGGDLHDHEWTISKTEGGALEYLPRSGYFRSIPRPILEVEGVEHDVVQVFTLEASGDRPYTVEIIAGRGCETDLDVFILDGSGDAINHHTETEEIRRIAFKYPQSPPDGARPGEMRTDGRYSFPLGPELRRAIDPHGTIPPEVTSIENPLPPFSLRDARAILRALRRAVGDEPDAGWS
ncbi:MAG TPA: hypothetical protein VFM05_00130 [Candidatus Saccharimonadales bacterium]|nr:hypothetical protein [Candidatus Saccharimonadales bacterium]